MSASLTRRSFVRSSAAAAGSIAVGALESAPWPARAAAAGPAKIKIGQIGTGHAHATKLAVYRRSAEFEIVGIVEPDEQLRSRAAGQAAYRDLPWLSEEQLLNEPGLQAVLVETRVRALLDTAERCVRAGKHIHLDKPAGESLSQYRRLLAEADRRGLLVQMGYMFRYQPAVRLLRQFLRDGWLGDIFEVEAVISSSLSAANRDALVEYRGGIMFELGCHLIDLVVGVLGKPDRVQSVARHAAPAADGLLDNMLAVCEYPRAIATVKSSAEEVGAGPRRHFVVCGTAGTVHIQPLDGARLTYTLDRPRGEYAQGTHELTLGQYERYVADAADMARILRGEKAPDFSYDHDLAVQETVLRASGLAVD